MENNNKNKKILSNILYPIFDILMITLIYVFMILSREDFTSFTNTQFIGLTVYGIILIFLIVSCGFLFRIYQTIIDNFGIVETLKLFAVSLTPQIVVYLIGFAVPDMYLPKIQGYTFALGALLLSFLMCTGRFLFRLIGIVSYYMKRRKNQNRKRTLIVGAGSGAKIVLDQSRTNPNNKNKIVAFIDDDPNKIGGYFSNLPVKGPISEISTVIDYFAIDEVIIAIGNLSRDRLKQILEYLESCDVSVKRLPLLDEFDAVNEHKVINVDITDLLGRPQEKLDTKLIKDNLKNKVVLVTGAGGSIGSELVRQIYSYAPKRIILFDIYEHGVYDLQQELKKMNGENKIKIPFDVLIGSTYNEFTVETIFKKYKPDYVYHAAAYKHVPLMEDSPAEAIRTNVFGTYNVAKMADKYACDSMTLISTDKAVRPTNVMGATKRFAEMIIQHFATISSYTHFSAVRFGNVLGSNGSVVPLFLKQIEEGGPLTVTDPNINRFFMTIPEAVGLILQSSMYAQKGEIFILDMGKPVKIITLAEKMIRQAGLVPYKDIDIVFTGLRPGEKLYEEILIDASKHKKTAHKKIFVEDPTLVPSISDDLDKISNVFEMEDKEDVIACLKSVIKTYKSPDEVNKSANAKRKINKNQTRKI